MTRVRSFWKDKQTTEIIRHEKEASNKYSIRFALLAFGYTMANGGRVCGLMIQWFDMYISK